MRKQTVAVLNATNLHRPTFGPGSTGRVNRNFRLDFNPTYFAHEKAADGFTLAHPDRGIRQFWIEHGIACRQIAAAMGKAQKSPCVNNVWIPDGMKDIPIDRKGPRETLAESLDLIFAESLPDNTDSGRRRMQIVRARFGKLCRRLT